MRNKYLPLEKYSDEYMRYLGVAKTERRSYAESVRLLEQAGFKDISRFAALKPGDGISLDELARETKLPIAKISTLAMTLRVKGFVRFLPGNRISLLTRRP